MGEAIKDLLLNYASGFKNRDDLEAGKRIICKRYGLAAVPNSDILKEYRFLLSENKIVQILPLEKILRKRAIRTLSGIAPVAVLTKPYPCPGACAYCPHEKNVPASYLSNEPAVMRAIRCGYDPYKQIVLRLKALENNGHEPTKIELIVIGGTWSYLPIKYKYWYIVNCFRAVNDFVKVGRLVFKRPGGEEKFNIGLKSPYAKNLSLNKLKAALTKEQKKNEGAVYSLIGLTLETRPDYINTKEILEMRALGATRVEIGVQAVDDKILKLNRRGHGVKEIAAATKLLKEYGFKVTYHLMPALPGATPKKDLALFKKLFSDERFQPDQIKFYPTVVTAGSLLARWYSQGKYQPYTDKQLQELIVKCKAIVPPYVRIIRLIRDIPGESIIAGNKITNLRQILKDRGVKCNCIRCREAKEQVIASDYKIRAIKYPSSGGLEYFISAASRDGKTLYGFCRLRIDQNSPVAPAIIRELHVYGVLVSIGGAKKVQHSGLGKRLMKEVEEIAAKAGAIKIAVISGVGVKGYYKKLGYKEKDTYMVKNFI
ncbi:MAG: tRNA uridine(34) 5-carboxymethylaminomethyl modification radical SAM/GNAT enzyme Elp3 [Candidatus Falkowbacteria bacterium]|nr:tRNA uridine(34) 5-carboxymethylaminomethyl modification radical SAM/GNAT enzyme Elp3 [Candidatus Falkowbacteria bacterium]